MLCLSRKISRLCSPCTCSYRLVLLLSVCGSLCWLFLTMNVKVKDSHARNVTSELRPRSCNNCFHVHYPYLFSQPQVCAVRPGQVVDVVLVIFSRPEGVESRTAIRNTWASASRNNTANFRHVFVTGITPDARRMRQLAEESRHFRDVVISGFYDSYNNLTLKTITSLRWVLRFCNHARFFFKVDDDVWLNTGRLLDRFRQSRPLLAGVGGYCTMKLGVIRDTSSKWYTSYESYPEDRYPEYCSGVSYGGTLEVAQKILEVSRNVPFFFLEDVYVGLCLRELNLPTVHFEEVKAQRGWDLCEAHSDRVISYHEVSPWLMNRIWNLQTCHLTPFWRFLKMDFVWL